MMEYKWGQKTPLPYWGHTHLARLLGVSNVMLGRYLNGLSYPSVKMIQKFEVVFGWPGVEQLPLIPYYWTWPDQAQYDKGKLQEEPTDMRYALKLQQVMLEWCDANPRTLKLQEINLDPRLGDKRGGKGGRPFKGATS